jgi:Fe2+ transport system protein FeoA
LTVVIGTEEALQLIFNLPPEKNRELLRDPLINFDLVRDGYLSTLFLNNGDRIFEIESLREFERKLCDMGFFRIRDNTIINGKHITEANKKTVKLEKIEFRIAKRRFKSFYNWFL